MKTYLLPQNGNFYKANLHSHSTESDGALTVEELKDIYKEKGYSVFAFTDHEICVDRSYLNDSNFLAITGYEVAVNDRNNNFNTTKTYHLNLYAKEPDNTKHVCFNTPMFKNFSKVDKNTLEIVGGECEREYNIETLNYLIAQANENGYIVSYNHPSWSLQTSQDYMGLEGLFAMEIYNHGCFEYNAHVYDEMLRSDKRIYCLANDDNHSGINIGNDKFGGFNMIKCPSLDYKSVMTALKNGDFYASTGPEIYDLYFENNKFHIKFSKAREVIMSSATRNKARLISNECDLTEAVFALTGSFEKYIRFTVIDKDGKTAFTRGYFFDEFK